MSVRLFGKLAVILFFVTFITIGAPSCSNSKVSKTDDEQSDTDFITIDSDAS